MKTVIFDLDKIERDTFKLKINGKEYNIKEPTVLEFKKIQELDFEEKNSYEKVIEIMCKDAPVEEMTITQRNKFIEICFKIFKGDGSKKKYQIEDLMIEKEH